MIQRRTFHVSFAVPHQVVSRRFDSASHPESPKFFLWQSDHQEFQYVPGTRHSLVEVGIILSTSEIVGRQSAVTILLLASCIDIFSDFVFGLQPHTTQWLALSQIHVAGVSESEQTVRTSTGSSLHRTRCLFLNQTFDAPDFAVAVAPASIARQVTTQRPQGPRRFVFLKIQRHLGMFEHLSYRHRPIGGPELLVQRYPTHRQNC